MLHVLRGCAAGVLAVALAGCSAAPVEDRSAAPSVGRAAAAEERLPRQQVGVPVPVAAEQAPAPAAPAPPVVDAAAPPAPAVARPDAPPAPVGSPEQRGREALQSLDYPWPELGYEIRFAAHRGGHLLGLANARDRVLTVYVRRDQSAQSLRVTIAHEIGHALDHVTGDDATRARYREVRGLDPRSPWYPCGGCTDYASPAGDFAEVFAYAVAGPGDFRSRLGPPPDAGQLQALAPLFAPPSQRPARTAATASASPSPSSTPRSQLLPLVP